MIIFFIDLDDTIFQTKRKNINGIYQATTTKDETKNSFMTEKQKKFFDLFFDKENIKLIPLTARNKEQYNRTFLKDILIDYSLCFAGQIYINDQILQDWNNRVIDNFNKTNLKLEDIYLDISKEFDGIFKIIIVENTYISIKHHNVYSESFENDRINILNLINKKLNNEYFVHENNNNLAIIPNFLDKKYACEYFINYYNPEITIGMADSISDYNFMDICDYKIIPSKTQLDYFINRLIYEKR